MKIQILGTGCQKCTTLAQLAGQAVAELGISAEICKVTELREIMAFGVMVTPALAVDGAVKVSGKVPTLAEVKVMLQ